MDYNYMQVEAAKKLLRQKADGSNANLVARQKARQLLRAAATDFANFAMKDATSKPAQYLFEEANNLLDICESYDDFGVPTEKDQFLDAHELDLLDKETVQQMLADNDDRFTQQELAQALHRKLNIEDALGDL